MTEQELNGWWASLTIREKERVAEKYLQKTLGKKEVYVAYPQCTAHWNHMSLETKERIYRHLTDDHGVLLKEWQEGEMMSE